MPAYVFNDGRDELVLVLEAFNPEDIQVYPNPANLSFTVEHSSAFGANAIRLLDGPGREINVPVNQVSGTQVECDVSEIPAALYYLKIPEGSMVQVHKISVTH